MSEIAAMTPGEFTERLKSGESWTLLDVREPWELQIARVTTSVNIPMAELPARFGELDQHGLWAVICHSGIRSAKVTAWLSQQGFATVANIDGGIDAWSEQVDATIPRY